MSKLKNCQRLYGVFGPFGGDQAKKRNKVVVHDEQRLLVLRFRKSGSYTIRPLGGRFQQRPGGAITPPEKKSLTKNLALRRDKSNLLPTPQNEWIFWSGLLVWLFQKCFWTST